MQLIGRVLFGGIALIIWLAVWLIGQPPAISMYWERADAIVATHETREVYDGLGIVQRTDPIIEVMGGANQRRPAAPTSESRRRTGRRERVPETHKVQLD